MLALYDSIGKNYGVGRRTDPIIASQIYAFLDFNKPIVNIGAGTGSYEPPGVNLIAVEPSAEMIRQRTNADYPVHQGNAECLPFENNSFSQAMAILSMHHWEDRARALNEIKRVTRDTFIALTWDPAAEPFWLTRDYFPEIYEIDKGIFPSLKELDDAFDKIRTEPLLIPANCIDGFTAAYWRRPAAYLDPTVRAGMSTFTKISKLDEGLSRLQRDIESGRWHDKNKRLIQLENIDVGYRILECQIGPS